MTRGFANYQLSDSATQAKYQIRGNGADFAQHENKVVQIQGVPDPKDSQGGQPIFYADTVKDTGQTCGNPQQQQMASNAAAPAQAGAATGSSQTASSTTQTGASNTQQAASSATPAATPNVQAGASPAAASAGQSPAENGANGSAAQSTTAMNSSVPSSAQSTASTQQGGTTGAAASATQSQSATAEDKGTPQAGTPQTGAVGAPSASSSTTGAASAQPAAGQTYQGCVSGDPNNLKFSTNGKDYHLQGDTRSVWKLIGHNVEVTGEDFGGKAIQISGSAKDLGSCKK